MNQKITEKVVEPKVLFPFILVTSLFALWGFANDITNPLVSAFKTVLEISNTQASLVQLAFYGGYFTMALPAAFFIKKYSYKSGVLMGLALYATGALLFYPAAVTEQFGFFLLALYILTFGLAFLETTANPFILSLGSEATATRRLNLAQSFNPMGSLLGMLTASNFILASLQSDDKNEAGALIYPTLDASTKATIRAADLIAIRDPYVILGLFVMGMFVLFLVSKMPARGDDDRNLKFGETFRRLMKNNHYKEGVLAQAFYVGAQIMCWTFIIQYAENLGFTKEAAQNYNILAMIIFLSSRFVSTWMLKYIKGSQLLMYFGMGGIFTLLGTIFLGGMPGLYCLIATSAFMSLMFPTIYGIALKGLGDDAKLGSAGLIMAIVGGALMPPLQGSILDIGGANYNDTLILGVPEVNFSFILPLICFVVVAIYGYRSRLDSIDYGKTS
ncbi:MAG: L-fucose:H+ symporter permease [Microscillaceae bacterium]|nr:L-fucose:H+ symporter permease [Microscillaceae bacterium]